MRALEGLGPFIAFMCLYAPIAFSADRTSASIYRCESAGVTTFSDRPCGRDAQLHTLSETAMNTYEAPAIAPEERKKSAKVQTRHPRVSHDEQSDVKRREACERWRSSLKEVRSKMRAGYNAKQGERLREREDKLRTNQREARCS